jgi:phosphatidylethanolamine-binding protein (PEBP) family uncharacterized protein
MNHKICVALALGTAIIAMESIPPASAASLKVKVDSIKSGGMIPDKYAFCMPAAQGHVKAGGDVSPPISWSRGPRGTKSYAIVLTDIDNPGTARENEQRRHDGYLVS